MFSKLMSQASQFAMEGVKNLVVKKHVSCKLHMYICHSHILKDYIAQSFNPSVALLVSHYKIMGVNK